MEWVRPDREADPGVCRHPRHPTADSGQDDARLDRAICCLDAFDASAVAVAEKAGDGGVLVDLNAAFGRARRQGIRDSVVAGSRALEVMRGAEHRVAAAAGQV